MIRPEYRAEFHVYGDTIQTMRTQATGHLDELCDGVWSYSIVGFVCEPILSQGPDGETIIGWRADVSADLSMRLDG